MQERNSLFSLTIDPVGKSHVASLANWARVFAVLTILLVLLVIATGVYQLFVLKQFDESVGISLENVRIAALVGYVLLLGVSFVPLLYLMRFARSVKVALAAGEQKAFNSSFDYLKKYFRFMAVVAIVAVVLLIVTLVLIATGVGTLRVL